MTNKILLTSLIIILLNLPLSAMDKTLVYRSTTDRKTIASTEKIVTGDDIIITTEMNDSYTKVVCNPDYSTRLWEYTVANQNTRIKAERAGNLIKLDGKFKGKEIKKSMKIDERPWFQSWGLPLGSFTLSDQKSMVFWAIQADNLKEIKMVAGKKNQETILINGREMDVIKVEVSLTGWMSKFWHVYYWFRRSDGVFVKYEGVNGPPGTPKTVTELVGE